MVHSALLDANVLHPQILCDLLLRLAEHDAFRPLWSAEILEETVESIRWRRPDLDPERLRRRMAAMNADQCLLEQWALDSRLVALFRRASRAFWRTALIPTGHTRSASTSA